VRYASVEAPPSFGRGRTAIFISAAGDNRGMRVSVGITLLVCVAPAFGKTLSVGPNGAYPKPCAALAAASAGDRIEIDAAGSYDGDVCGWKTNGLTLVGVNGRAKIDAAGQSSGGKAIWVIGGDDTTVENIE